MKFGWLPFYLAFVCAAFSTADCGKVTLHRTGPTRVDILLHDDVFPRIQQILACAEQSCRPVPDYGLEHNVIHFGQDMNVLFRHYPQLRVTLNLFSADHHSEGSVTLSLDMTPRDESQKAAHTGNLSAPSSASTLVVSLLIVAICAAVVVVMLLTLARLTGWRTKDRSALSEYVFNQPGEGTVRRKPAETLKMEKELQALGKKLGHIV